MSTPISEDYLWAQLAQRDPNADGQFIYGVVTTGIFCWSTCPSRRPKRENVRFFTDATAAISAGFRACKRCKPDLSASTSTVAKGIVALCRWIESAEQTPSLNQLAEYAGISASHLHRLFKSVTGLTPKGYAQAYRAQQIQHHLTKGESVSDAIFQAGYHSSSRFYAEANQMLGMTPSVYRAGGIDTHLHFAIGNSSLGKVLVAQSKLGICAVLLGADELGLLKDLQKRFPSATLKPADSLFEQSLKHVIGLIDLPQPAVDLPLDIRGTAFQRRVWQALKEIPLGETRSYVEIAQLIGAPKAVRAVAGACAANAIAVLIPCHRVLRTDGSLSGYRWGKERKHELLQRERATLSHDN